MKYFTYWEGKKVPYIELCYETMKKHIPEIIRLNENNVGYYLDLPERYYKIKAINHRVDYLKANLIYKYGGFWLDADTIVLKPMPTNMLDTYDYFGCPGFFGATKDSKTLKKWIDHMDVVISKKLEFEWAELILPMVWENNKHQEIRNIDKKLIAPYYDGLIREVYFKDFKENIKEADNCYVTILYNKVFPDWFKKMGREEILNGEMVISELFRRGLYGGTISLPSQLKYFNLNEVVDKVDEIIKYLRYKNI